jgi:hypothetical protein
MIQLTMTQQELSFDIRWVHAHAAWTHPAVLAATVISTSLLFFAVTKASLAWQRLSGVAIVGRLMLILLGCLSYIVAAVIHIAVSQWLFRIYERYGSSVSVSLNVPVFPVWILATLAVVTFHVVRNWRKRAEIQG